MNTNAMDMNMNRRGAFEREGGFFPGEMGRGRGFRHSRGFGPEGMNDRHHGPRGFGPDAMGDRHHGPRGFGPDAMDDAHPHGRPDFNFDGPRFDGDGPRFGAHGHDGPGGHNGHGGHGGMGGPGGHGGPGGMGGPGGPGWPGMPGGRPPRRPDPEFLKRMIDEGDLLELIDLAGRMVHRRPQGGPARGQALILSILAGRESLSQRELQRMLGIQPGSLSELLGKLEAKGLLTREKAEDRRGNLLRITDAGRQALPQGDDTPEDDPFAPLTPDQQEALAGSLRTLLTAWVEELGNRE